MDTPQAFAPTSHRLRAGTSLRIGVQRGSTLLVQRGRIVFRTPPYWLADTLLAPCMPLNAEESSLIGIAGWLEITALETADVLLLTPQPRANPLAALAGAGRRLWHALRRRWSAEISGRTATRSGFMRQRRIRNRHMT